MSRRAPKGVRWETVKLWVPGWVELGRSWENCFRPKAVKIEMMLVSWEKSR